jgi:putative endonuclease
MASDSGTLYVGSTTDLDFRVFEHQSKKYPKSFTAKYNCIKLVFFEEFDHLEDARLKEYQIKQWSRANKIKLIRSINTSWIDLSVQRKRALKKQHNLPFPEEGSASDVSRAKGNNAD